MSPGGAVESLPVNFMIVEDESSIAAPLARHIEIMGATMAGLFRPDVRQAGSYPEAMSTLEGDWNPDIVIVDHNLGDDVMGRTGYEVAEHLLDAYPDAFVIAATGHANERRDGIGDAVFMRYKLLEKQYGTERLFFIEKIAKGEADIFHQVKPHIEAHVRKMNGEISPMIQAFQNSLPSESDSMRQVINKLASSMGGRMLLLTGEPGSGKSHIAKVVHDVRNVLGLTQGTFEALHLTTSASQTAETELFGVVGEIWGAKESRAGVVERSNHGTVFLDELGVTSLELQANLLHLLQDFEVSKIGPVEAGKKRVIKTEAFFVMATNANLRAMVRDGTFREDLFNRVQDFEVRIPSLRERPEDVPVLVRNIISKWCEGQNFELKSVPSVENYLTGLDFPNGGVRSLVNCVQAACRTAAEKIDQSTNHHGKTFQLSVSHIDYLQQETEKRAIENGANTPQKTKGAAVGEKSDTCTGKASSVMDMLDKYENKCAAMPGNKVAFKSISVAMGNKAHNTPSMYIKANHQMIADLIDKYPDRWRNFVERTGIKKTLETHRRKAEGKSV